MRFRELPGYASLFLDFVEGAGAADTFFREHPGQLQGMQLRAADVVRRPFRRSEICALLRRQAEIRNSTSAVFESIRRLEGNRSVVVLSAQPAGLCGGVLQTLLKALTAARLAHELQDAGVAAVAICWMDSTNTSREALRSLSFLDSDLKLRRHTLQSLATADDTTARLIIPEDVRPVCEEVRGWLSDARLAAAIAESCTPGRTFSAATASFVSGLLDALGVIVWDPSEVPLQELAPETVAQMLSDPERLSATGRNSLHRLEHAGYFPPAAQHTSIWRHDPGSIGAAAAGRLLLGSALPCVTAVSDSEEILAHAASMGLYEACGIVSPVIWPAASATLVDARSRKILDKYDLEFEELFGGIDPIVRRLGGDTAVRLTGDRLRTLREDVHTQMEALARSVDNDEQLHDEVQDVKTKILFQLEKVQDRFTTAAASRNEALLRQIERVCNSLAPGQHLQERELASLQFLARYSLGIIETLYHSLDVWHFEHQLIGVD